jgi:transcriptional regulator with XRE-family HTH domain
MTTKRGTFDADGFFAALDAERQSRGVTWKKVAEGAGISPSTLTRLAQGKRPDVDSLAALTAWSGLPIDNFVRRAKGTEPTEPAPLAMISTYLRSDPALSAEAATALDEVVKATYERLRRA